MERSISRRGEREQTPVGIDDEATRAAITEQCIRKEPTAATSLYDQERWVGNFERPWVLPNMHYLRHATEIEGGGGHIFCRVCVKPKKHGKLLAFKLHVTIQDEDPMQVNKYGIITLECHGCGFEQIVPRKPKLRGRSADGAFIDEYAEFDSNKLEQAMRKMPQFPGPSIGRGISAPPPNYGQALGQQHEFLNHIAELRRNGVIDEHRYAEFIARYTDDAQRRVEAMKVGPPMSPLNPNKWPVP